MNKKESPKNSTVISNKKAFHDYFIEETYEAGLVLTGTEVKSIRGGQANLKDSFARIENGEVFLYQFHVSPYAHGNRANVDPERTRKLLLHKKEISRLFGKTQLKGYALIPLKIFFRNGKAKVELGLGQGKKTYDKREDLKIRAAKREVEKAFKERQR
ncbi:MAG: SsrA-binding protein SmpB [Nitrospirae bacterium]|nr:SsrA-binding protein SmpB [Nitrospirota bacterium]MBI3594915.1 SsrA-binding protein SmpB [Nitrospirota bacterium]